MRAIDADALIEELNASHFPGAPYVDAGISIAIGKVCDALTIEPQRTGKWKRVSADKYIPSASHVYRCSRCGDINWLISKFCPNCGARMEDPEDIPMEYFESGGM